MNENQFMCERDYLKLINKLSLIDRAISRLQKDNSVLLEKCASLEHKIQDLTEKFMVVNE